MFGLVAWGGTGQTANQENAINSIADPDITTQNNNFIFTGAYNLMADMAVGASVSFGRYSVAQWNGRGRYNIPAVTVGANPTSPFMWNRYMYPGAPLPQNQQIQPYLTNTLASGTEAEYLLWKIATPDWKRNLPAGQWDFWVQATATLSPVVGSWVLNNAIAFDVTPLGGVYAVIGAQCFGANGIAWRLGFPRTRMYLGRRLRPGNAILSAFGKVPDLASRELGGDDGVWGAFHTFEPPVLDILGSATSSTKFTIMMHCLYLGEPLSLLDNFILTNY